MPGLNRTGPMGQGPMTGRGMGLCGGGMAWGKGRGFGRGMGRMFGFRQPTVNDLEDEKSYLEGELNALKDEISQLKKKK